MALNSVSENDPDDSTRPVERRKQFLSDPRLSSATFASVSHEVDEPLGVIESLKPPNAWMMMRRRV